MKMRRLVLQLALMISGPEYKGGNQTPKISWHMASCVSTTSFEKSPSSLEYPRPRSRSLSGGYTETIISNFAEL